MASLAVVFVTHRLDCPGPSTKGPTSTFTGVPPTTLKRSVQGPTGAALGALMRYSGSTIPAFDLSLERKGDLATLTFNEGIPLAPLRRFAFEVLMAALDTQTRTLYGEKPLPVLSIELPYPEPEYASQYRKFFYDVEYLYDRPLARTHFEAWLLDEPIPFADPATAKSTLTSTERCWIPLMGTRPLSSVRYS